MRVHQQVESVLDDDAIHDAAADSEPRSRRKRTSKVPRCSLTADQQAAIAKISDKYLQKAFNLFTIDELLDDMAGIYQRHVSCSDVDAYIAFYQFTAGPASAGCAAGNHAGVYAAGDGSHEGTPVRH